MARGALLPRVSLILFPFLPRQRKRGTETQQRTERLKHRFRADHRIHGLKESGDLRTMARQIVIHFSLFFLRVNYFWSLVQFFAMVLKLKITERFSVRRNLVPHLNECEQTSGQTAGFRTINHHSQSLC